MISETIYSVLSGATGITSITTGIFPSVIPQKVSVPAVVYQCVGSDFIHTFEEGRSNLVQSVYQIDAYAKSVADAETLGAAVLAAIGNYKTHPIQQVTLENRLNLFEPDTEYHRVLLRFAIWHSE